MQAPNLAGHDEIERAKSESQRDHQARHEPHEDRDLPEEGNVNSKHEGGRELNEDVELAIDQVDEGRLILENDREHHQRSDDHPRASLADRRELGLTSVRVYVNGVDVLGKHG